MLAELDQTGESQIDLGRLQVRVAAPPRAAEGLGRLPVRVAVAGAAVGAAATSARRLAALARGVVGRLLRPGWKAGLCWPARDRHRPCGTRTSVAPPATAGHVRYAARRAAAARQPVWLPARVEP